MHGHYRTLTSAGWPQSAEYQWAAMFTGTSAGCVVQVEIKLRANTMRVQITAHSMMGGHTPLPNFNRVGIYQFHRKEKPLDMARLALGDFLDGACAYYAWKNHEKAKAVIQSLQAIYKEFVTKKDRG